MRWFLVPLILVTAVEWAIILSPSPLKYEDTVCEKPAKLVRYPDGMREPYCKPTGIVWITRSNDAGSWRQ
jgi:hypothetical protein